LVLLLERRHRRLALGVGGAAVVALLAVLALHDSFRERLLSSTTGRGSGDRHELIAAGLSAVRSHPLVGTGLGHFRVGEWARPEAPLSVREHRGKAHNLFLSTAAEMGSVGLALLLVLLGWLVRRTFTSAATAASGAAGLATVALYVLLGLVHDPLFHAEVSLAFVLAMGVALGEGPPQVRAAPARDSSARA
jgi:O-antigen ligase